MLGTVNRLFHACRFALILDGDIPVLSRQHHTQGSR